jgi:hypothetical protein
VVCDGDVDPEWIETLNSVLDDNRLLTMPNGERIQFANNVNFIFECHSLQVSIVAEYVQSKAKVCMTTCKFVLLVSCMIASCE